MQIALSFANGFPRCRGTDTHTHENVPRRPRRDNDNNDKEYKKNKQTGPTKRPANLSTSRRQKNTWIRGVVVDVDVDVPGGDGVGVNEERRRRLAERPLRAAAGERLTASNRTKPVSSLLGPSHPPVNPRLFLFSKLALPSGHSGNHSRVEPFPVNIFNPFLENVCRFRENFSKNSDIQEKKTTCSISSWGGYWMLLTTSSGV